MFPVIFHVFKEKSFRKGILLANSCMQASIIHLEKLQQDYLLPDMFKGVDVQMVSLERKKNVLMASTQKTALSINQQVFTINHTTNLLAHIECYCGRTLLKS